MTAKVRIAPESLRWLSEVDAYICRHDLRGVQALSHAASDALDGTVFASELQDLRRRELVRIVKYGTGAQLDQLAGYAGAWSAELTEKAMCFLWPDRLEAKRG